MVKIFAHRGSAGTHPENTIASFAEAIRVGADGIELDVHLTKDEEVVVIHDSTLDRTTNGKGRVRDFALKELRRFDAGSWFSDKFQEEKIPVLSEVLSIMKDSNLSLNIELKNVETERENLEESVIKEVERYKFTKRVIISSFNHYALKKVNQLNPEIECAILYMENLYEPWNYAGTLGARSLHPQFKLIASSMMEETEKRKMDVRAYTVNQKDEIQRLIEENCAAIITDYPEKALRIRETYEAEGE